MRKMFLPVLIFCLQLTKLSAVIPFDGIIHRSSDGSSYAFLAPPKTANHASFIEEMSPNGTLAVAWFTGAEGQSNTSIAVSLLAMDSAQFTPGLVVSERVNFSNQNPVLYWNNNTQILHLYHSSQIGGAGETNSQLWHVTSKDRGATWSQPQAFYTLAGSFDRNRIIPTFSHNGYIFPCYNSSPATDYSFLLRLPASGSKLTRVDIKNSDNLIQPTIIRLNKTQQLRSFFRDENAGSIYYADSSDDGLTWTTPKPTILPNNNAGIQAYVLKNGAVIMAFNNHNGTKQPRTPLTVALSYDNGLTWPHHRDVQLHDDDSEHVGEYSYPSILQSSWMPSDGNDIHLVYTYDRLTIKYVRFNENWVKQGQYR